MSNINVKNVYFSDKNLDFLYNMARQEIESQVNYDISRHSSNKANFKKMVRMIYNKTGKNNQNLTYLNKKVLEKTVPYFTNLIRTRRQSGSQSNIPPLNNNTLPRPVSSQSQYQDNLQMSIMQDNSDVQSRMNNSISQRQEINNNQRRMTGDPSMFRLPTDDNNSDVKRKYDRLKIRNNVVNPIRHTPQSNNVARQTPNYEQLSSGIANGSNGSNSSNNSNNSDSSNGGFNILPFSISNMSSMNDIESPLYQNMRTLEQNEDKDPMKLYQQYQSQRDQEVSQYLTFQDNSDGVEGVSSTGATMGSEISANSVVNGAQNNAGGVSGFNQPTINSDVINNVKYTQVRTGEGIRETRNELDLEISNYPRMDPATLYRMDAKITKQMMKKINSSEAHTDLVEHLPSPEFQKMLQHQRNSQPEFVDRVHYVNINSVDRRWTNDVESRYNFLVHFNPDATLSGAGVNRIYRNVVSIELLGAILPLDSHPIPFDQRLYVNILSYPYLCLHIKEIDGVFEGTNSNIDKAFAYLVFDKDQTSDLVTSYQSDTLHATDANKQRFGFQYKRGFIRFCPLYFEKKEFYNNPLASLGRMTIQLRTPDGQYINDEKDHLDISSIAYATLADKELDQTPGFPGVTGKKVIEITTTNYFSNRLFRVGDKIKISDYTISSSGTNHVNLKNFINRSQGHHIINLDVENMTAGQNQGYINKMYISPPGTIDATDGELDTSTNYEVTPTVTDYGNLINDSLQTHFMFKITTRETNVSSVITNVNV